MFVPVELGATQKSASLSPTKIYTPLQVVETAQICYSNPDFLQQTSAVDNNDGIENISLANLAEFPSFGPLFLPNSADTEQDIPTEEIVLSDQETPKMSAYNSLLRQTPPVVNKERETATNTTTSPRFAEFLRAPRGSTGPVVKTKIVEVDTPLSFDVEGAEPKIGGTREPVEHAESHDLEAHLSTDSLSCLWGETNREMVQQVTITRQEAIALTIALDKIPRTALQRDNQDLADDITLNVVDKSTKTVKPDGRNGEQ